MYLNNVVNSPKQNIIEIGLFMIWRCILIIFIFWGHDRAVKFLAWHLLMFSFNKNTFLVVKCLLDSVSSNLYTWGCYYLLLSSSALCYLNWHTHGLCNSYHYLVKNFCPSCDKDLFSGRKNRKHQGFLDWILSFLEPTVLIGKIERISC